jgi:hypothetical protein
MDAVASVNDLTGVLIVTRGSLLMQNFPVIASISTVADVPRGWLHVRGWRTCYNVAGGTLKLGIHSSAVPSISTVTGVLSLLQAYRDRYKTLFEKWG